ncbi:MAG: hypothetical protein Tsb009_34000 [Planctomycetaceae bacterium]
MDEFSTICSVLNQYDDSFRLMTPHTVERHRGFSGAEIHQITTQAGNYALRGWRAGSLPRERLRGLHRLLAFIFERGVDQVAVPVSSKQGETLVAFQNRLWQLEPWMPGEASYWQSPSREKLRSAMETLAAWHRAARQFLPEQQESTWFRCEPNSPSPAVAERLQKLIRWQKGRAEEVRRFLPAETNLEFRSLSERVLRAFSLLAPKLMQDLQAACQECFPLQPCLRDIWHDHVLYVDDQVTGLIDPSACRLENVTTDLARLLGSLVGDDREAWNFAVEVYAAINPLKENEWRLMRLLDRSTVLLSGVFWLNRWYFQPERILDREAVIARMKTIVARQEALLAET